MSEVTVLGGGIRSTRRGGSEPHRTVTAALTPTALDKGRCATKMVLESGYPVSDSDSPMRRTDTADFTPAGGEDWLNTGTDCPEARTYRFATVGPTQEVGAPRQRTHLND